MAINDVPTVLPNGVTNAQIDGFLASCGMLDPARYSVFFDDFQAFRVDAATTPVAYGDWLVTNANSGTLAVADANNGILEVTNGAATDNFFVAAQWQGGNAANVAEIFALVPGKQLWLSTRFKLSSAIQMDAAIGLYVVDADPIGGVADGFYFLKADDAATVALQMVKSGASTTSVTIGTLADDTYVTLGAHYNGQDTVSVWLNDQRVGGTTTLTNLPTTEMAVSFVNQNGTTAAAVLSLDYISVISER